MQPSRPQWAEIALMEKSRATSQMPKSPSSDPSTSRCRTSAENPAWNPAARNSKPAKPCTPLLFPEPFGFVLSPIEVVLGLSEGEAPYDMRLVRRHSALRLSRPVQCECPARHSANDSRVGRGRWRMRGIGILRARAIREFHRLGSESRAVEARRLRLRRFVVCQAEVPDRRRHRET